jgi:hypothetical protein
VIVPAHAGGVLTTGADGVIVLPQLSVTVGGVGATASAGQATVEEPGAGSVTVGVDIVYVYTQS